MDKQQIEILGRNRLISELVAADLEVSIPIRDRGVDIIAYRELSGKFPKFVAAPIQMKAASNAAFSIDEKYQRISSLILAFVWGLRYPDSAYTYALTHKESLAIAKKMKWKFSNGRFSTSKPSEKLRELLESHKIKNPDQWWEKIQKVTNSVQ